MFPRVPYSFGDEVFIDPQQIIPTHEAADFMIGMAAKDSEEKSVEGAQRRTQKLRHAFWTQALQALTERNVSLFENVSLEWRRMDDKKANRIVSSGPFDGFNESVWPEMVAWLCDHIVRLEAAFSESLSRLNRQLKSGIDSATAHGTPRGDLAVAD